MNKELLKEEIFVVKANGRHEPFDSKKLLNSLVNSGASEEVAQSVLDHIIPEIHKDMTTGEIYRHAFDVLRTINRPVARSYSLRRAVMELGPSGFPFEDFVAEILRAKGFKCETRQVVLGECVPHEVDVVAYTDTKLIMIEAKFHNELGTKSDLKVALYIKARFDDIKENLFNYGGKDRRVTDSWLITNTKFSSTAIHYGVCKNLTMIGWNYPEGGGLKEMIEEEGLHPVTCLTSLSQDDKESLLASGVVMCSKVRDNPKLLSEILGSEFKVEEVINEIKELYK